MYAIVDIEPLIDLIRLEIEMLSRATARVEKQIDVYFARDRLAPIKLSRRWDALMTQLVKSREELKKLQRIKKVKNMVEKARKKVSHEIQKPGHR